MKVFYSDHYAIDLPPGHRFPLQKYRLLREALLGQGVVRAHEMLSAEMAPRSAVMLAHTPSYYEAIASGPDPTVMRRIGLPWSEALVRRSLASVGGAIAATDAALEDGVAGNLAGGTHHAFADAGEGFCIFNDLAVVTLKLLQEGRVRRVAIIDLDVHQGNGNAAILGSLDSVFLFSMHGEKNFPFRKVPSTLDIGLPDGTMDAAYLSALEQALPQVLAFDPELVLYQAGVDPLREDRLGRLSLSMEGLAQRDRLVLQACYLRKIPVSLALGGGYAQPIVRSVEAHVQTYRIARQIWG